MKASRIFATLALAALMACPAYAQHSHFDTPERDLFECGEKFYRRDDYSASVRYCEDYLATLDPEGLRSEKARLSRKYIAFSAFYLRRDDAKLRLEQYIKDYPYTSEVSEADLYLGILEIEDGRYSQALKRFDDISASDLDDEQRLQLLYYNGYACINTKKWKDALYEFDQLMKLSDDEEYSVPAHYYHGVAHYNLGNYKDALKSLEPIDSTEVFDNVPYLICLCLYNDGDCGGLMKKGEKLLAGGAFEGRSEVQRLMGACAFGEGDYAAARDLLTEYRGSVRKMSREDWYLLGMSHFQTENWAEAVECLSKVPSKSDDDISQNSYFHIGSAYLKLGDKNKARMAFESASKYKRSPSLREDALYNYAVLTYLSGSGHFNESLNVFERFLSEFPESKHRDEIYRCLVNIYLTTNNYTAAYNSIQKIKTESPIIKEAEERVLYGLSLDCIANRQYAPATRHLKKIVEAKKNYDAEILRKSMFWYAECLYKGGRYDEAISYYKEYLEKKNSRKDANYAMAYYGIGYCHIKKGDYAQAPEYLSRFCTLKAKDGDKLLLVDAHNRIGDCYFYRRQYPAAYKAYEQAYELGGGLSGADYALYSMGMIAGLQRSYDKKIQTMQQLLDKYPKSDYVDDAMFEMASAYEERGQTLKAISAYEEICGRYKRANPLVRKARLQIAMLQYNSGDLNSAIESFKYVVQTYPRSEEASTALSTLEIIMVDNNRVAEYNEIAKKAGKTSSAKEDSLTYKASERIYFKDDFAGAEKNFRKYLETYPEGRYANLARYYMANCLFRLGRHEAALVQYALLAEDPDNPNMELTLRRAADLSYDKKDYKSAYGYYSQLKEEGSTDARQYAKAGMLRSAYEGEDYRSAIDVAGELVLENSPGSDIAPEARYKRMKSYLALGEGDKALPDMEQLSKDVRSEYGAEAKYLLAQRYYDIKNYDMAEKEFFSFVEAGTPHAYWMARAFLLIADVYSARGEYFEAKQYLQSLKDNYDGAEADIAEGIETRMETIQKHEEESVSE